MEAVIIVVVLVVVVLAASVKTSKGDERVLIERLGRPLPGVKGPGVVLIVPFIDRVRPVSLGRQTLEVKQVDVITRDNRAMRLDLALVLRLLDPHKALYEVNDYRAAMTELVRTCARAAAVERAPSSSIFDREAVAALVRQGVESAAKEWGVGIEKVEVTAVG